MSKKTGKNHIIVAGRLLQINKKWSHLKQKQRDWIYEIAKVEHEKFIEKHNKNPMKTDKKELIEIISDLVENREIWLPYYELEQHIGKYIDKLNKKAPNEF